MNIMIDYEQKLANLRSEINTLDNELLDLLSRRFNVTHEVGKVKVANRLPIKDEKREVFMFDRITTLAKKKGLDPQVAENVLRVICQESVNVNQRLAP
jgi:monofunctional chorismate mutase